MCVSSIFDKPPKNTICGSQNLKTRTSRIRLLGKIIVCIAEEVKKAITTKKLAYFSPRTLSLKASKYRHAHSCHVWRTLWHLEHVFGTDPCQNGNKLWNKNADRDPGLSIDRLLFDSSPSFSFTFDTGNRNGELTREAHITPPAGSIYPWYDRSIFASNKGGWKKDLVSSLI